MGYDIANGIKNARKKIGFTQQQLADALGITRATLSSYENGKTEPDFIFVIKFALLTKKYTPDDIIRNEIY